ncbi:MAG: hypothetical protein BWY21_01443 [Parcubacteria group bacterium ADurb.Bin216]|nr:MAG: hypothetical protein BWY21_01443 [Parcubacteria group bacterium ADurb.Bin216]
MIISFKVTNFYSINEELTLDLSVKGRNFDTAGYIKSLTGNVSMFAMIVGANASGKTNILKAFSFLRWLILRQSNRAVLDTPFNVNAFPHKRFFNNNKPTSLCVVFEIGGIQYEYYVEIDQEKVLRECLKEKKAIKVKTGTTILFNRSYDEKTGKYVIKSEVKGVTKDMEILHRKDVTIFSIGSILNNPLLVGLSDYWRKIPINIFFDQFGGLSSNKDIIYDVLVLDDDKEIKKRVERILKKFDLGLDEIILRKKEDGPGNYLIENCMEKHVFGGVDYESDIRDASMGTQRIIRYMRMIISALRVGAPVFIDELDAFLHPAILSEVIDLFLDEEKNSQGSQLIFSSHSHAVMNKLDKYQIFIVEKNDSGSTEVNRLGSLGPDVRNEDNFYSKYISGYYGGNPRL